MKQWSPHLGYITSLRDQSIRPCLDNSRDKKTAAPGCKYKPGKGLSVSGGGARLELRPGLEGAAEPKAKPVAE